MPSNAQRIQELFLAASAIEGPAERAGFLEGACAGDAELRSRVEVLLRAHDQPDSLLDQPAVAEGDRDFGPARTIDHESGAQTDGDAAPFGFLTPATRPDSLGRIGHYEVLQVLGQGGFGIVFRAFDEVLHRVVAVKVLSPQIAATSPARKRFLREARSSAQVRHENVVQVYEVGETPLPYIALEFIPGETLQQRLDRCGPLDVPEVLRIGRQIAEGLAAAHANDLIHRDIKPGNVLLEGGSNKAKITDFGLARAADDASISQSGIIAGTPMFMAPEQALGHKIDQRADLFSLGSVLYQMTCGRPPFRAPSTLAVLKRVAEEQPRPIPEIIPETPAWLCAIIAKLHAKNPDERYQSAREIADVLADCESQLKTNSKLTDFTKIPVGKRPDAPQPAAGRIARSGLFLLSLAGLIAIAIALGLFVRTPSPTTEPKKSGNAPTAAATDWPGWSADAPKPAIAPFDATQALAYQEAWAKHLDVPVEYANSIGMKFRLIPPGEFMMGSTAAEINAALRDAYPTATHWHNCIRSEAPQHKVILTQPTYLGIHEVTQAEYERVMGTNPSHFAPNGPGKDAVAGMNTSAHPVEKASCDDAMEFCEKLSQLDKLKPASPGDLAYRLPSEAEWEFACRAGTTTKFWSGDNDKDLERAGWFGANAQDRTHAVGELNANPFGLFDTHGNVWEWVQDGWNPSAYGAFQHTPAINPNGLISTEPLRVIRGGRWYHSASYCRSSFRLAVAPTDRFEDLGFRVSLSVEAVKAATRQTP